jgi:hypothetical protein
LTALSLACPFLCCRLFCQRCNGKKRSPFYDFTSNAII